MTRLRRFRPRGSIGRLARGPLALLFGLNLAFGGAGCVTPGPHSERPPAVADDEGHGHTRYVDVGGAWVRVRQMGPRPVADRPTIVFVHGYGSRLEAWKLIQPAFSDDHATLSLDQRGFGLSERPAGPYGPEQHAADLWTVCDELGIGQVVFVAHSYGGGVIMRAALQQPERVAALAMLDPFLFDRQVPQSFRWAQAPVVGELLFGAFYKEVPGEKYLLAFHDRERFVTAAALDEMQAIMARPGSVYAALQTVRGMDYAEHEDRYESFDKPFLLLWGEQDRVTPLSVGKEIAGRLDVEQFVVLPASGHMPSWERPDGVLHHLVPFVERVANAAAAAAAGKRPTSTNAREERRQRDDDLDEPPPSDALEPASEIGSRTSPDAPAGRATTESTTPANPTRAGPSVAPETP